MTREFGSDPADIRAAIGPCISRCCFETEADVPTAMKEALGAEAETAISGSGPKYHVDLKALNRIWLRRAGVRQIAICPDCTACLPHRYWSHRVTRGIGALWPASFNCRRRDCDAKVHSIPRHCPVPVPPGGLHPRAGDAGDGSHRAGGDGHGAPREDRAKSFGLTYQPEAGCNPYTCTRLANRPLISLMYQGLFSVTSQYQAEPVLCERYSCTSDRKTYRFQLAEATFSDGSPLGRPRMWRPVWRRQRQPGVRRPPAPCDENHPGGGPGDPDSGYAL